MLNYDFLLISAILKTKDLTTVEKLKIGEDFLVSPECKSAFKYLRKYYHNPNTYGHVPSVETFQQTFVGFPIYDDINDSIEVICQEIRSRHLTHQLEEVAEKLIFHANNKDPYGGFNLLRERGITLTSQHDVNDDLPLAESADLLEQEYMMAEQNKGILGIPWPWSKMNEITMGMQKGHLIYVRAKAKTGKTMNMIAAAVHAYMHFNARVLVYSMEMRNVEINRIAACFIAGLDLQLASQGKLNPADKKRYFETNRMLKNMELQSTTKDGTRPRAWLTTSGEGSTGISSLKAKIIEFDPDIVLIDGVYLLYDEKSKKSDSDWKTILNISRSLKSMQKELKVRNPIRDFCLIGIIQSDDEDGMALAKYMRQDCDISILLQTIWDGEEMNSVKAIKWTVDSIRSGKPGCGYLNYFPCIDFSEREPPEEQKAPAPKRARMVTPNMPVFGGNIPTFGFGVK